MKRGRAAVALLVALVAATSIGAEHSASEAPAFEEARRERLNTVWPGMPDREAVVMLEFDLGADGKVSNIRHVDEGFYEQRFVDAAMKALRGSRWRPRHVNGQPVQAIGLRQGFRFFIDGVEPGITQDFRKEAKKVEEFLQKRDFAGGEFHARWMLSEKVKLSYEYAVLQAQLGQTYAGMGRMADAESKLAKATAGSEAMPSFLQLLDTPPPNKASNYVLGEGPINYLLGLRMHVLAAQGLALEALHVYYQLAGLETVPADDPRAILADELTAMIKGDGNIRARIEVGETEGWRQFLSRSRFTLEKVRGGSIDQMILDCSAGQKSLAYVAGEEWTVPEGWAPCAVVISAAQGVSFEFVELPGNETLH